MKFLIDAQLPPALALWLRESGHEAVHVTDAGLREADDAAIWAHALRTGEDFAVRSAREMTGPVIISLRGGNTTNRALRAWIEPRLPGTLELLAQGSRLVEVI